MTSSSRDCPDRPRRGPVPTTTIDAPGTVVLLASGEDPDQLHTGIAGRRDGFEFRDEPWSLSGLVCIGRIEDGQSHSAALDAVQRGCDLIVAVSAARRAAFVDDLDRLGVSYGPASHADHPPEWTDLLNELAGGASIGEAARRCHMSRRTAYRRLAQARLELGAGSTTEAVAVWMRRRASLLRSLD